MLGYCFKWFSLLPSYVLLGTHQLALRAFEDAMKFMKVSVVMTTGIKSSSTCCFLFQVEDIDIDEVQCIVANLIDKVCCHLEFFGVSVNIHTLCNEGWKVDGIFESIMTVFNEIWHKSETKILIQSLPCQKVYYYCILCCMCVLVF